MAERMLITARHFFQPVRCADARVFPLCSQKQFRLSFDKRFHSIRLTLLHDSDCHLIRLKALAAVRVSRAARRPGSRAEQRQRATGSR